MSTDTPDIRAPFAEQTQRTDKRHAGRTEVFETPLEIRNLDGAVDDSLHAWVHERLGRQLGKYAPHIERIDVRFGDENGPKGGIDRCCMIHVIVSALAPVVVEMRAGEDREAFDLAAGRVERALKRSMQKHGFNNKHKGRHRGKHGDADVETVMAAMAEAGVVMDADQDGTDGSDGATSSGGIDTALPGVSADMRKAGDGRTAQRNVKTHTDGMPYALEDSTQARPSRKSTRAGKNRIKHGQQLALRTKGQIHSPQMRAARAGRS
jgi:putative sigma-54 modulation protein